MEVWTTAVDCLLKLVVYVADGASAAANYRWPIESYVKRQMTTLSEYLRWAGKRTLMDAESGWEKVVDVFTPTPTTCTIYLVSTIIAAYILRLFKPYQLFIQTTSQKLRYLVFRLKKLKIFDLEKKFNLRGFDKILYSHKSFFVVYTAFLRIQGDSKNITAYRRCRRIVDRT